MARVIKTEWVVAPCRPPEVHLHCGSCGTNRVFQSSGRVRLNAHGKRLDSWLIYRCATCDRTWNRSLAERASVREFTPEQLHAMQHSTPSWVRDVEFDLASLKHHSDQVVIPPEVVVRKEAPIAETQDCVRILLQLRVLRPTGVRLDRLLAGELGLSRSRVQQFFRERYISTDPPNPAALKRPLQQDLLISIAMDRIPCGEGSCLLSGIFSEGDSR